MLVSGVEKSVVIAEETTWGVASTDNGQTLRRVSAEIDLARQTFTSAEIIATAQTANMSSGTDSVSGTLNGELSATTYKELFGALLRGTWSAGGSTASSDLAINGTANTITRTSGSFITDGFKQGDYVTMSGFSTTANNASRLVLSVTALVMTVDDSVAPLTTEAAGASATIALAGKKLFTPTDPALRSKRSFTVESFWEGLSVSEVATGMRVASAAIAIKPNAMTTVNFSLMGKTVAPYNTKQYASAATPTTTSTLSASKGRLIVDGALNAVVTGINLDITGNLAASEGIVGSRYSADIFLGRVGATGSFTAYFDGNTLFNKFVNDTDISLVTLAEGDGTEAIAIKIPRLRITDIKKSDSETGGVIATVTFTALQYDGNDITVEPTTVVLQDTTL